MTIPASEHEPGRQTNRLRAEIAHVLFVDLVGYSLASMEEQARMVGELRSVVRATPEFRRAEESGELLRLDTGDGIALVFSRDPLAPVQCATEIARALRAGSGLRVRMGIHTGPISRMPDINGKETVTGSGINMAQRVMDCGDAGHILLSAQTAEFIREFAAWSDALNDLGEVEVKHGARLHLYNLLVGSVGNPARPSRLNAVSTTTSETPPPPPTGRKVALLYRRGVPDDERLLQYLEEQLGAAGLDVFVDRHLTVGVAWAEEIEKQIRSADAVIPLLSAASIRSEMLEYEIRTARDAADAAPDGRPRLLPVRVAYEGPLPDGLASILDPLQYALWRSGADDAAVAEALIVALAGPPSSASGAPVRLEPAGGAVPLDSTFYIVRPTDDAFQNAIARQDSIVLVKGGRQMGKTSLLARGLQQARGAGARVVLTDFQALSAAHLTSADTLFRTLAEAIADQLDLDVMPDEVWNEKRAANTNLERYLRKEVLGAIGETPLVWGMDEVDRLFTCPFGSEVFGLFRSWHNRRSLDPTGPWSRLTLAIAYATEAHLFITDLNQSPFNVGTRLTLDDFTVAQVAELNRRYGAPLASPKEVTRFHDRIGGQPYLTRRGLDEIAERRLALDDFLEAAGRDEGPYGDHLRRILITLTEQESMLAVVRGLLRGETILAVDDFYRLRAAGIVVGESAHDARLRCPLYAEYLSRHLA